MLIRELYVLPFLLLLTPAVTKQDGISNRIPSGGHDTRVGVRIDRILPVIECTLPGDEDDESQVGGILIVRSTIISAGKRATGVRPFFYLPRNKRALAEDVGWFPTLVGTASLPADGYSGWYAVRDLAGMIKVEVPQVVLRMMRRGEAVEFQFFEMAGSMAGGVSCSNAVVVQLRKL